ncbi:MAG TPA: hypothetical protein DEQ80_04030 [Anaerolinea thermolimosa]|uniref:DUF429 domain-containing protein n=1 Tax=Anaerolinea thermolimosa TaxID=229919 RepID=A0A3D1JGX5_9CHLR|nr:hypothetical protein [Anaerolinea thermolimosa]
MPPAFSSFIGVDAATGRRPFTYLCLDPSRKLLAVGSGTAVDVLSFAFGQSTTLLAFSPPHRTGQTPSAQGRALGDFLLQKEWYWPAESGFPRNPPPECPSWLRASFLLIDQLQELGFRPFAPEEDAPRQWLETQAEAAFSALLERPPLGAATLEGRLQRQLVLADLGLDVPDAMEFFEEITRYRLLRGILPMEKVLPAAELNAWMAAQVAWMAIHQPEALQPVTPHGNRSVYLPLSLTQISQSGVRVGSGVLP